MNHIVELTQRYPVLLECRTQLEDAVRLLSDCFSTGGKLLICGNEGSCADAQHIVGELMKGFVKKRPVSEEMKEALIAADPSRGERLAGRLQQGLAAIALTGHPGLSTAFLNDVDGEMIYAQQITGFGKQGDVFLGITTSGNSENIMYAAVAARAMGMKVLGLTGRDGGRLKGICDAAVVVPENETYKIQELHLPIYHALCLMLEEHFFNQ